MREKQPLFHFRSLKDGETRELSRFGYFKNDVRFFFWKILHQSEYQEIMMFVNFCKVIYDNDIGIVGWSKEDQEIIDGDTRRMGKWTNI